jgi:methionyl-tRNA synthetase
LQGEKVRKLKSETKDKTVWQPEVNILLELKKKLAEAEKAAAEAPKLEQAYGAADVAALEAAVAAQGDKVRKLKSETKDKAVIQPAVNDLLELKKKLEAAQKSSAASAPNEQPAPPAGSSSVAEIEAAVTAQAFKY